MDMRTLLLISFPAVGLMYWAAWAFQRWLENRRIERRAYYRMRGYKSALDSKPSFRWWWTTMHK